MAGNTECNRRTLLSKSGAAVASGIAITGFSDRARAAPTTKSAEEAGIAQEVNQLMDEGKRYQAIQLLDQHGVTYRTGVDRRTDTESSGVSTSDFAQKDETQFNFTAWVSGSEEFDGEEHDIITVEANWIVEDFSKDVDAPAPKDVTSIYWESNVFGLVTGSIIHNGHLDFGGSIDDQYEYGVTAIESPNLDDGTEGVTVSYDDTVTRSAPPGNNPAQLFALNGRGRLKLKLRRQISSYGNIRGEYSHNWSIGGRSWDPSNVSLSIGSAVSYNLPSLADNWVLDDQQDI